MGVPFILWKGEGLGAQALRSPQPWGVSVSHLPPVEESILVLTFLTPVLPQSKLSPGLCSLEKWNLSEDHPVQSTRRRHAWVRNLAVSCHFILSFPPPTGGISVTHTGLPIMVSLANTAVSFSCRINYQDTPPKGFTFSFFHEDLHGKRSLEKPIDCKHSPGTENQTLDCEVKLSLPNASATGTYYCLVRGHVSVQGSGTFILVRGKASS